MSADDRNLAVDLGAMVLVGAAICVASHRLTFMTAFVTAVFVARLALTCRLGGRSLLSELPFVLLCTIVGGANDWNTVVRHRVYDYLVPTDLPGVSTIPLWMLLYWGIILRAIATLARSPRLGDDTLRSFARPLPRVAVQLALVLATRQAIYRLSSDPLWSWAPFALGLVLYLVVLRPPERARRLALVALVVGPPAEMALIHVGGLHRYALGWLYGVPLWIALWWALGALVWSDLAPRIEDALLTRSRRSPAPSSSRPRPATCPPP